MSQWGTLRPVFALFSHREALWEVTFDRGTYRESRRSIIFLREETAFTPQNKQNKPYLKSGAHRAAKATPHSGVSTGPIRDVTLTTDKWKSHSWPDSEWKLWWKEGKFEWTHRKPQKRSSSVSSSLQTEKCLPEAHGVNCTPRLWSDQLLLKGERSAKLRLALTSWERFSFYANRKTCKTCSR